MGVSVLRGMGSGRGDEAQGHGIWACSQGVSDQWCDDLIGDESASAICGDEALEFLEPVLDEDDVRVKGLQARPGLFEVNSRRGVHRRPVRPSRR